MDKSGTITQLPEWKALQSHQALMRTKHLKNLFADNSARLTEFSLSAGGIFLDYSNTHCESETLSLLTQLAQRCHLTEAIRNLFLGEIVNTSEKRPALHTALRDPSLDYLPVSGKNIVPEIQQVWQRMEILSEQIRRGDYLGYTGKRIKTVINIGIGGSDLGPKMLTYALQSLRHASLQFYFVSNLDQQHLREFLPCADPETTLFIISSKTFTTHETLSNFHAARQWFLKSAGEEKAISQHFIAVTAAPDKALELGFNDKGIFPFWPWVGGRYSIWSAVSLSVAIAIGMSHFKEFLAGGHDMDQHFRSAPFDKNMPVLLALLTIWYGNFWNFQTQAIIPYYQGLSFLPDYLQQLCMESLGKSVQYNGTEVDYATGSIIWGGLGTNSQHSFHQLLLQGTQMVPTDFVLPLKVYDKDNNHEEMIANCFAQSEVFSLGYQPDTLKVRIDNVLSPHVKIEGNRPHNLIMLEAMNPKTLGALIALYEHKVYVQSVIWNINAFDQWGVQRAKQIAETILDQLRSSLFSPLELRRGMVEKTYDQ